MINTLKSPIDTSHLTSAFLGFVLLNAITSNIWKPSVPHFVPTSHEDLKDKVLVQENSSIVPLAAKATAAAGKAFNYLWNPVGGLAALAVGAYLVYRYWNSNAGVNVTNHVDVHINITGIDPSKVERQGNTVNIDLQKSPPVASQSPAA